MEKFKEFMNKYGYIIVGAVVVIVVLLLILGQCEFKPKNKPLEELVVEYIDDKEDEIIDEYNENFLKNSDKTLVKVELCCYKTNEPNYYTYSIDSIYIVCYFYFSDETSLLMDIKCYLKFNEESQTWYLEHKLS